MATNVTEHRTHHISLPGIKTFRRIKDHFTPEENAAGGGTLLAVAGLGMFKAGDKIHQALASAPKLTKTDIIPAGQNPLDAVTSPDFPMHLYNLLVSGLLHDTALQGAEALKNLGIVGGAIGVGIGLLGLAATLIKHSKS